MYRNLFDLDNARYLNKKELVDTFIPTEAFERILSPKNQIIIGSRGSGKTALLKMISHDHLSLLKNKKAEEVISTKLFIGTHISTKTKFIGGLKNKQWQSDTEKEYHFRWLMNMASCVALLETIKSCLNTYYQDKNTKAQKEIELIEKISALWLPSESSIFTINDLEEKLEDVLFQKSLQQVEIKIYGNEQVGSKVGLTFDLELFEPLIAAINIVNRKLEFPEHTSWFICIDEIEILEEFHHKILNSYMRAYTGRIFFKFTTLPYSHYTLETNTNVPLEVRHDVHYVYIDQDASFMYRANSSNNCTLQLFQTRARLSKPEFADYDFSQLFGHSMLLDRFGINMKNEMNEEDIQELILNTEILKLFEEHAGEPTRSRGIQLLKNRDFVKFGNEIGRKMRGLLILKDQYAKTKKGNQAVTLYSGAKIVITVGDANPRKLLGIFNEMLKNYENTPAYHKHDKLQKKKSLKPFSEKNPMISYSIQNFVLVSLAERELNKSRIEKNIGQSLYDVISTIGNFMKDYIHENKLTTEQISSIELKRNIDDNLWEVIKRAVQKGLLYPNKNVHNPDEMPFKEGTFHIGYILSPKFKLLPRRGDARNVLNILPSQLNFDFDA